MKGKILWLGGVAGLIFVFWGGKKMIGRLNVATRNNNPGNLRFAGQKESIGKDERGFARFATPQAGWRALLAQIRLDSGRGLSLRKFIYKYAPPEENSTIQYLHFVATKMKTTPDSLLEHLDHSEIAKYIGKMEGFAGETITV